jgi:general secretion pathway protein N
MAVFVDQSTHTAVRLRTGEGHTGWILQAVQGRAAILQKGAQSETLTLPVPTLIPGQAPGPPPAGAANGCNPKVAC